MEIRSDRCGQAEAARVFRELPVLRRRMAAGHHFDRAAAVLFEYGEQLAKCLVVSVEPARMRYDGNASAGADPPQGICEARPLVRDIPGFAFGQILFEDRFNIFGMAAFDQETREMSAPDHAWIRNVRLRAGEAAFDAQPVEFGRHALCALDTAVAYRGEPALKRGIVRIET